MTHEEITLQTKKMFAASLKKRMEKKTLSKITVSEIALDCNVNRKTFYYHFKDIYDLLQWMLEQEAIAVVKEFDLMVDHEEALAFVLDYVEENQHILKCACDSMGRGELKRFFFNDFIDITSMIIDTEERRLGQKLDTGYKAFLCEFYTEALAGTLLHRIQEKTIGDREQLMTYVLHIYRDALPHLIASAPRTETVSPEGK